MLRSLIAITLVGLLVVCSTASARSIRGSSGANTLKGTNNPDTLNGRGGADKLLGRGADDKLAGETGPDKLYGGFGNDYMTTGSGGDISYGGPGNDTIIDDYGTDVIYGQDGDDDLSGGPAPDDLFGGNGNDTLRGGSGADRLQGGPGNDLIWGDYGVDTIDAGPGDDTVYINDEGVDRRVDCGEGNDILYVDPKHLPGGEPDIWSRSQGRFSGCEQIIELAPPFDPFKGITWSSPNDYGDHDKTGTELNDKLLGYHGSNRLFGLAGDDIIWTDAKPDGDKAKIRGQRDFADGGAGNDTIYASPGTNEIFGREGNDYIQGNTGGGVLLGGEGNDTIRARAASHTRIDAGAGDDLVIALINRGRVTVDCGPGHDTIEVSQYKRNRNRVKRVNCEVVKHG